METHKKFLEGIASSNSQISADIKTLTAKINQGPHDDTDASTRSLLARLYDNMITIGENRGSP